jgi:hypothetical protein
MEWLYLVREINLFILDIEDLLRPSLLAETLVSNLAAYVAPSKAIYGKVIMSIVLNLYCSRIKYQDIVLVLEFLMKVLFQARIEEA